MSYKFDSLIMILNKLDARESVTVRSLMDDLEVSERTAYRYVQTLQVAGFPISYDRGKNSYVFADNYTLKKPHLTVQETLAFALAKSLVKGFGDEFEKSFDSLERKLSLKKPKVPSHIVLPAKEIPQQTGGLLETLHRAITDFRRVEINYKALHDDRERRRRVDPYYLFYQDDFWHLRGYCHKRQDFRTFALDRVLELKVLDEHFVPRLRSPKDELSGSFGGVIDGERIEVVLKFDREIKPYVLRKKWHQSQTVETLPDGGIKLMLAVNGIDGVKQWIHQWHPHVEVLAPRELREAVNRDLREALRKPNA